MRTLLALLVLTTAFAGCASDDAAPADEDLEQFQDFDDEVSEDLGIIRGVVVDATIAPIAGAEVTLPGLSMTATTNEKGAFQFVDVTPGLHQMRVSMVGYESVNAVAEAKAGEISPVVRVQLFEDPQSIPIAVTYSAKAYTGCSFRFGITSLRWACDDVDPPLTARFDTGLTQPPTVMQSEMTWRSNQALGDDMRMFVRNGDGPDNTHNFDYIGLMDGSNPLTCYSDGATTCGDEHGLDPETWTGWVHVDGAASCFNGCVDTPIGGAGAGFMVAQGYEVYLSVFVNMVPDEGWTFVADGHHPAR